MSPTPHSAGRRPPPPAARQPLRPQTQAVLAGRPERVVDAPLNPAVTFASTYIGAHDPTTASLGYGRNGNPTWEALEQALGALEGGRALTFASGMAAVYAVLEGVPAGATVVIPGNCYLGTAAAIDRRAAQGGWTIRRVDVADTDEVLAAGEDADLVWVESPTNPVMEVADLPRIGAELPARALLVVDNTFATPLLQRPLDFGADVVLHSVTKLIGGHSDLLLGALVTRADDEPRFSALLDIRTALGATPGVMEAYLALRGLRTLPVRQAQAQASAQILAERLSPHPRISRVRYPGLPTDPGHDVAARVLTGFGTLLSVELADARTADAFIDGCELWVFATSLGGVESMFERRRRWAAELPSVPEGLVRLSVGLEHVEDLWEDLERSLDALD